MIHKGFQNDHNVLYVLITQAKLLYASYASPESDTLFSEKMPETLRRDTMMNDECFMMKDEG